MLALLPGFAIRSSSSLAAAGASLAIEVALEVAGEFAVEFAGEFAVEVAGEVDRTATAAVAGARSAYQCARARGDSSAALAGAATRADVPPAHSPRGWPRSGLSAAVALSRFTPC